MAPIRAAATLLLGLTILSSQGCAMASPPCFSRKPDLNFPRAERVRPNLTHGEAGRRLYDALVAGDRAGVAAQLRADPRLANLQVRYDTRGDRPAGQDGDLLTFAVTACDEAMLATLLDAGVPADGAAPGLALSFALLADAPTMAELLLRSGASPDPQKRGGVNLMREVAAAGQLGATMMLVRHGLDQQWVDRFGRGHLETALDMDRFQVADVLAAAGAPLWRMSQGNHMPVHNLVETPDPGDPAEAAAHARLIERARRGGRPWPPPPPGQATPDN
ncbi:hypothetical protein SAMN06297144_1564 [Sphingomonas guangdongensis]|uniref:Uncharacterized protein n=1 Tax=Sphingomonas guangdongensis TaxID=1141890 RepID=A0A285QYK7_9SPHN|nr:hypothetical protein [Sphingomonas guangdongensis]SOB86459.1 hypothetical protein SAMN06297144_1564 [Sphingomonas guangdongensis]